MKKVFLYFYILILFFPIAVLAQGDEDVFRAEVIQILEERKITAEDGVVFWQQDVELTGLEGERDGQEIIFRGIDDYQVVKNNRYQVGDKVIVSFSPGPEGAENYYITDSRKVLNEKDIAGIIVTDRNRILCADVYSSPGLFEKMYPQLMQSAALGILQEDRRSRKRLQEADVEEFLDTLRKVGNLKKETSQTYRLLYRRMIGGAELYSGKDGTRVVHLEAYPR